MGRFTSPDPDQVSGFDHIGDPQSWNSYSYVRNNPLRYTDPDGMEWRVCDENGKNCSNQSDQQFDSNKAGAQQAGEVWKDGKIYVPDGNGGMRFGGTYQDMGRDIPGNPQQNLSAMGMIGAGEQLTYNLYLESVKAGVLGGAGGLVASGVREGLGLAARGAITTLNIGRFAVGQVVERVIMTPAGAYTVRAIVAGFEGDTIILKEVEMFPAAGGSAAPGAAALKAGIRALRAELGGAGYSFAKIIDTYRVSGVLHVIDGWTISLR
jgi:hypothetical protein